MPPLEGIRSRAGSGGRSPLPRPLNKNQLRQRNPLRAQTGGKSLKKHEKRMNAEVVNRKSVCGGPGGGHTEVRRAARAGCARRGTLAGSYRDGSGTIRGRFEDGSRTVRGRFEDGSRVSWRRKRRKTAPETPAMARSRHGRARPEGARAAEPDRGVRWRMAPSVCPDSLPRRIGGGRSALPVP